MKSPIKLLTVLAAGGLALLTGCASDRDYEVRNAPQGQFYCQLCEETHPYQHSHYPYYEEDRAQTSSPRSSRATFITQPGRSSPMGPEPEFMRPSRPLAD